MRPGLAAAALLAGAVLLWPDAARQVEDAAMDRLMRLAPRTQETAPVLRVEITEADLARLGRWPWPRERLAELIRRVAAAGPAVLGLDLALPEAQAADPALAEALLAVPSVIGLLAGAEAPAAGLGIAQVGRPDLSGLPALPGVERSAIEKVPGALGILPGQVVRAVPLLARVGAGAEEEIVPGFALAVIARALGTETLLVRSGSRSGVQIGPHLLPLPRDGLLRLDPAREPAATIAAGEVLSGEAAPEEVRGRVVLIGVTAAEVAPLRPSVLGPFTPSLAVQAEAVAQLAAGWVPRRLPGAGILDALAVVLLGVTAALAVHRWPVMGLAATLAVAVAWPLLALLILRQGEVLLDPAAPAAGLALAGVTEAVAAAHRLARDRARLLARFAHRLPTGVAEQLLARPEAERLRPELCRVAVVITDLAGFSGTVRSGEPARVVAALNAYLAGIEAAVLREGGTLERLVGDSVLAVFGAPLARPDDAARALAAARAVDRFCEAFRHRPDAAALGWGETRIGVAAGDVLAGEVGGSRLTWAVCGDAANVAARLQELGKTLGRRALVTGIEDPSLPPPIGRFELRGLPGEVAVRPLDP